MPNTRTKTKVPKDPTKVGINVLIAAPLRRRVRVKAISEGLTLGDAIEAALKEWLR